MHLTTHGRYQIVIPLTFNILTSLRAIFFTILSSSVSRNFLIATSWPASCNENIIGRKENRELIKRIDWYLLYPLMLLSYYVKQEHHQKHNSSRFHKINLLTIYHWHHQLCCSNTKHKQHGPIPIIIFFGNVIDTIAGPLQLPNYKLKQLLDMVSDWFHCKSCTCRELESHISNL